MDNALTAPAAPLPARIEHGTIAQRLAEYESQSKGAFSANTVRAIRSDTAIFTQWCAERGAASLPAFPKTVAAFVADMGAHKAPATVGRYVSSIDHLHRAAGLEPVGSSNAVRLALRSLRRAKGTAQRQAKPLRRDTLDNALAKAGTTLAAKRDRALLALAYDTLCRASELVALDAGDVSRDVDGATCYVARSKTDQEGAGSLRHVAPDTFAIVQDWITAAGLGKDDPLFCALASKSKGGRLTTRDVARIYKARVGDAYSPHSSRVGAAVDQKAGGISTGEIMTAGGWASERMVSRYTVKLAAGESGSAKLAKLQGRA